MKSLQSFITSIIDEHKSPVRFGTYRVDVRDLPLHDKKLFLSHILDSEEYENALDNDVRATQYFNENIKHIQSLVNNEINSSYCNDMYDSGLSVRQHKDNGEITW